MDGMNRRGVDIYRGMGKVKSLWKATKFSNPE